MIVILSTVERVDKHRGARRDAARGVGGVVEAGLRTLQHFVTADTFRLGCPQKPQAVPRVFPKGGEGNNSGDRGRIAHRADLTFMVSCCRRL